ncbi:hypothetical protein FO519_005050 [Halicephalobus sp. NKZ332]|nr:hypothetical protein FO519_005050 [Halicephalobus sp. NKZ332]
MLRSKRGFMEYVSLADFGWLHKFLEMVFGDLYTDLVDNRGTVMFTPSPPESFTKSPFEAALKPWVKNITSLRAFTRQSSNVPQVSLPYPHIFTTPKWKKPTTTEAPSTPPAYNPIVPSTANFLERVAAPFVNKLEKATEFPSPKEFLHSKTTFTSIPPGTEEPLRSCETCQAGKQCSAKLRSFETTDPIFQYAYTHSTPISDLLESVMKETQSISLPPPFTWKSTTAPETVQLTMNLMTLYKPNRSLVIGVFTGLAIVGIASVTDSRGIVIGLEYPENVHLWERVGMKYAQRAGIMNRIQVRSVENVDKALAKLAAYEPNAFDFIFVSDLRKVNNLDDYEHAVRLLRTNGLLVITDALESGAVIAGPEFSSSEGRQAVQTMNSRIKTDPRVSASLLPYGGGTWIIVKN